MKIPKKLKCGLHTFDVSLNRSNDSERGTQNWGKTIFIDCKILIDKDVSRSQIEETFFHELLHCCMFESKLGMDLDDKEKNIKEEDVVVRLTPILLKCLKDNKFFK